jgi:hypothetical protein
LRIPTLKQVAISFAKQLKEAFDAGTDILTCFRMYLGFLMQFANPRNDDKPYGQFDTFQIDDMMMSIYNSEIDVTKEILETFWLYTRRGGKTKNLTVVGVFFALLGKLVLWRSSFTDQLNMARYWFNKNPFVVRVVMGQQENHVRTLKTKISFDVISEGKTQSRGCDVIILDEECCIAVDSKKQDVYEKLLPSLGDSKFKHFLHGTTPELNTVAEINFHYLKDKEVRMNTKFVSEHPWQDCPWITKEFIAEERIRHSDDPYYVAMQYELQWTVLGGKVFNNVIREGDPKYSMFPLGFLKSIKPDHGGVDFNGDINEHYLVLIKYDDNFIYVTHEIKFIDLEELFREQYWNISLELEDGLYNDQFTRQTKEMGLRCIYNLNWTGEKGGDSKMSKVQELRNRKIIINKENCPQTFKNLNDCAWNRHALHTEILKTKDQHGLDALLHALHVSDENIYAPDHKEPQASVFQKNKGRFLDYQG